MAYRFPHKRDRFASLAVSSYGAVGLWVVIVPLCVKLAPLFVGFTGNGFHRLLPGRGLGRADRHIRGKLLKYAACSERSESSRDPEAGQDPGWAHHMLQERWQEEALRCWGQSFSHAPGFIADFLPSEDGSADHKVPAKRTDRLGPPKPIARSQHWHDLNRPWCCTAEMLDETSRGERPDFFEESLDFLVGHNQDQSLPSQTAALDICCGDALFARCLAEKRFFQQVFAMDMSWSMLKEARELSESEGIGPEHGFLLARADAQQLPFRPETLDCVVCALGLHNVDDPLEAMRSMQLALKFGGRLWATAFTYSKQSWFSTKEDVERLVREAGLSIDCLDYSDSFFVLRAMKLPSGAK
eukprot:TRINITY_DN17368_c0_g1_i1.p1 TRINITY_DN17368_c0_g1~~TRINITY_DN17368_c0_g1_i1.p1  ORF type:complete len:356 (+),score=67.88 TRINITY_DN17368_c0_g1_i1:24-1091(+)